MHIPKHGYYPGKRDVIKRDYIFYSGKELKGDALNLFKRLKGKLRTKHKKARMLKNWNKEKKQNKI